MGDNYIIKKGLSRFPTFHYKELEEKINSKSFSRESFINSLILLKKNFEQLEEELKNIINSNLNNFNGQSDLYKRRTMDYLILCQIDIQLCQIILDKINEQNKQFLKDKIIEQEFIFNKNKTIDDIKNKYKNDIQTTLILERVQPLLDKLEILYKSNHKCGNLFMNIFVNYILCYMKEIFEQLKLFKELKINKENDNYKYNIDDEIILLDLILKLEKLDSFIIFLSAGYFVDEKDVLNQEDNSEDWKNIFKIGYEVISSEEEKIQETFRIGNIKSEFLISTIMNSYKEDSFKIINAYNFISKFYQYKNDQKIMLYESKKAQLIQNKNITNILMDITLWPVFKKLGERNYQKINFRKKIYVRKEYPDITLEYIQKLLKLMGNNFIDVSNIKQEIIYKDENDIINNKEISKDEIYKDKVPKNLKKYYVSITILNTSYITFPEEKNTLKYTFMNSLFQCYNPEINENQNPKKNNLFIFIHGGGFIGMSTHFHESFLRDWVNELNIPIIGINYGLSPQHKYPYAINDCYQAYRWIIDHCEEIMGFIPEKIILGGDSSGATFILSLTYLLIAKNEFENENIRIPDLILPIYPCCNTSDKIMSTSFLLSIRDFLLNDKFLLYVNKAYRDNYPNDDDPFLNPIKAKECILKKFPRSRWEFGSCDPLRDDSIRLIAKISKIKDADIKAYEFKEYNHAWNGGVKNEFLVNTPTKIVFQEIREVIGN